MGEHALTQAVRLAVVMLLVAACSRSPDSSASRLAAGQKPEAGQPVGVSGHASPSQVYDPGQPRAGGARPGDGSGGLQPPAAREAAALLPATDTRLTFEIRDQGAAGSSPVQELLLRDGARAVAVANGQAYAVWEIRPDGVWRADPRNPGTLLRYLPPQLSDGVYWSQKSGDAVVWFRLSVAAHCSQQAPTCWEVVVLNRGERTTFRFAGDSGPISAQADNWAEPDDSFDKYLNQAVGPAQLAAAERERLMSRIGAAPPSAPVTGATAAQFEDVVFAMVQSAQPSLQTVRLDLNDDGHADIVQGRLDEWTTTPLHFYRHDGSPLGDVSAGSTGRMRVTRLPFPRMRVPAFLIERPSSRNFGGVAIVTARENPYMNMWAMEAVYGWAPKADGVIADRVSWTVDGRITVEWDMLDPARHTRVTTYTWSEDQAQHWSGVKRNAVAYRPQAQELRYPATPQELLQAAFVARWLGLTDELPRYFASREAAAAFAADERVSQPDYQPGSVRIGTLTLGDGGRPLVTEAEPQGPGPHSFAADWGGYEWCASVWGWVTFGGDAQGRPVIVGLQIEGQSLEGQ
ncbi:MAG: hypothetical protein ACM3XM_01380 [Mycobacterium leprae]